MKFLVNSILIIVLFIITYVATAFSHAVENGLIRGDNLSSGVGLLLLFILIYLITFGSTKLLNQRLGKWGVSGPILFVLLFFIVFNLITASFKFTIKFSPFYICWILGFLGGRLHYQNGFKPLSTLLLVIFPVALTFNLHEMWLHKIEYGNFTGALANPEIIPFEFIDKEQETISHEDLKGKVVWLDFWFIGCPPCWKLFPEVQRVFDENKDNPSFKLYAVNNDDDPDKLFNRIEEKGYTFPVLRGTQKEMDALGVYVYPTVILLNRKGEVIFMGEFDEAESMLDDLLKD